jgi:hypothetical protein
MGKLLTTKTKTDNNLSCYLVSKSELDGKYLVDLETSYVTGKKWIDLTAYADAGLDGYYIDLVEVHKVRLFESYHLDEVKLFVEVPNKKVFYLWLTYDEPMLDLHAWHNYK